MKLFDVYPLMNITPVKATGCTVTDTYGNDYLDFYGGHAVISVGHSHPWYIKRMTEQLKNIGFYSNAVQNPMQQELAEQLGEITGYNDYQLFLCNSGAEANENALKLASFTNGKKKIIAFNGSFHGRTSAAVAATNDLSINSALNLQHEVIFLPLNDFESAASAIDPETCAVIIEGIQGVAGIIEPSDDFLIHLQSLCKKNNVFLILDEVQSGCGRTGKYFAHQHSGVQPDIITMAKGIGNGFPVGAVLIAPEIQPKHGMLGTTFGGNYLACAAALAVIEIMQQESLMENSRMIGQYLIKKLSALPGIKSVTGKGLMIGIELESGSASFRKQLLEDHKIFVGAASNKNVIRLLPPLNIGIKEAEFFLQALENVLHLQPA